MPIGAAGKMPEPEVNWDVLGRIGRGALDFGVGIAAPFFQVSATEQPTQRKCVSGGPATTSGGRGSSQSGQTSDVLTTERDLQNLAARSLSGARGTCTFSAAPQGATDRYVLDLGNASARAFRHA